MDVTQIASFSLPLTPLVRAKKNTKAFSILNVHLDPYDRSHAMERLGKRLSERVGSKKK